MEKTWLVVYDISNSKRLRKVLRTMKDYGDGIQKSVFLCHLNASNMAVLQDRIGEIIHHTHDQVIFIPLHRTDKFTEVERWTTFGRRVYDSDSKFMIF